MDVLDDYAAETATDGKRKGLVMISYVGTFYFSIHHFEFLGICSITFYETVWYFFSRRFWFALLHGRSITCCFVPAFPRRFVRGPSVAETGRRTPDGDSPVLFPSGTGFTIPDGKRTGLSSSHRGLVWVSVCCYDPPTILLMFLIFPHPPSLLVSVFTWSLCSFFPWSG